MKPIKPKKCRACRESFQPKNSMHVVCSPVCGLLIARQARERREAQVAKQSRAETRKARERLKTRAYYAKEAQTAFNAWIRERDRDLPCVSCGMHHQGKYDAGHYRTVASAPELRYEPLNVHKQCSPCNTHKSGNIVEYRINLVKRIGADKVEWLEGPHEPKRYTIDDLQQIAKEYRAKTRELKRKADEKF